MVYFQTKYPNLGKFWKALECKMLIYVIYGSLDYITYILWPFGELVTVWYIFPQVVSRKIWQPWLGYFF
jgi:hypothetical protein